MYLTKSVESADIPHTEIGWGRLPRHLDDIVVCPDDTVRVAPPGRGTDLHRYSAALRRPLRA
jgi:hypothetical protein